MGKRLLLLISTLVALGLPVTAQNVDPERRAQRELERRKSIALEAIANLSPDLAALKENTAELIMAAANTDNPSVMPHLKLLASDRRNRVIPDTSSFLAHIALAKLGDAFAISEIFLEVESEDYLTRSSAILKLARSGNKECYRKLFVLLDDTLFRGEIGGDEIIRNNSQLVMNELTDLLKDAPKPNNGGIVNYDIGAWKEWFSKNKHLIE